MSYQNRKTVVICGSGNADVASDLYKRAESLGDRLGQAGYSVATGGFAGVMEAALKGAHQHDVATIGVTLSERKQAPNQYLSARLEAESYHARLMRLVEIGDAFVVLEGGTGTLLELAMTWALKSRGLLEECPLVCLADQWREVIETLSFYSEAALSDKIHLQFASDAEEAVELISQKVLLGG